MLRLLCSKLSLLNSKASNFTSNGLALSSFTLRSVSKMSNSTNPHSFTVSYLKKSCGLSQESAISASNKICIENPGEADSFLKLMKKHGVIENHLKRLIEVRPSYLVGGLDCRVRTNLKLFKSLGVSGTSLGKSLCSEPYMLVCPAREFVDFFRAHGLSDKQIGAIIVKRPKLFQLSPSKTFWPKARFLKYVGLDDKEVSIVLSCTVFLEGSLDKKIIPCSQVLMRLFGADIFKAVKFWRFVVRPDLVKILESNVLLLKNRGVPESAISAIFKVKPSVLVSKLNRVEEIFGEVAKLGFEPNSKKFVVAVRYLALIGETLWDQKFEAFKRYGMSSDEIYSMFKKQPMVMRLSVEKIERLMDFYVDKLKMKPSDIWTRPHLFRLSLENNLIMRCSVLQVLMLKNALNREISISTYLRMTGNRFAEKTVTRFRYAIPDVVKAHQGELVYQEFPNVLWLRK